MSESAYSSSFQALFSGMRKEMNPLHVSGFMVGNQCCVSGIAPGYEKVEKRGIFIFGIWRGSDRGY